MFKSQLARWATYLVKETGRKTRDAVAMVLAVDRPCRKEAMFNKVTRGLEARTVETRGAGRFRTVSGSPKQEGLDWSQVMWRRTKDMWTGQVLEDLHVGGKPEALDLFAPIPGGPRDIITTFWFDVGGLPPRTGCSGRSSLFPGEGRHARGRRTPDEAWAGRWHILAPCSCWNRW